MGQFNLFKPDEEEKEKGKKKSFVEEKNLFGLYHFLASASLAAVVS